MDWTEALELVIARTKHEPYRALCDESHPNHLAWRAKIVAKAEAMADPQYPSLIVQAGNVARAAGRVVAAIAKGDQVLAPEPVREQRLAICEACEFFDANQRRCTKCGCGGLKVHLATERCPVGKWEAHKDG